MKLVCPCLFPGLALLLAPVAARAEMSCGDLLIVLDRSGSMQQCRVNNMPKQDIAKAAITNVVMTFPTMPMGLFVFPNTLSGCQPDGSNACTTGIVVKDITDDGGMQLSDWIKTMPGSCGGTPTGPSMEVVRDYAKWSANKDHFVLLITDGQPTCQDGDNGGTPDPNVSNSCLPGMVGKPCDGRGSCECKNPTRVYNAIKALADKAIHTFVVGFAGAGAGNGCTGMNTSEPFNPATLNMMADLGREPQEPPATTKYYSATDATTLNAALKKILGKIAGGTTGACVHGGNDAAAASGTGATDGSSESSGADAGQGAAGGKGASGGQGAQGGAGGDDGTDPGAPGATRKSPGCACHLGSPSATPGFACVLGLAWVIIARRYRRR